MKNAILCVLASIVTSATALNLANKDRPGVTHLNIQRRDDITHAAHVRDRLRRRDGTLRVPLDNQLTLYYANVSLGTPPQTFRLHIDTGSSDLWVNSANSDLCQAQPTACDQAGTYNANASSSYTYKNSGFNVSYIDSETAVGDYATDTLLISGLTIQNFQFGIGYLSNTAQSILGIGYPINEVSVNKNAQQPYNNLPAALSGTAVTPANAYSLYLNSLTANTGSILFGGVDTAKYIPPLLTVPIVREFQTYAEFIIALTALGQNGTTGSIATNQAIPALLDSGSSLTYLPDALANSIFTAYNAQYDAQTQSATVDCALMNSQGTLDFTFSGATVGVSLSELVLLSGATPTGQPTCIFGISRAGSSTPVLGDTFLRSAYVVYDLDANEIALASTRFNATDSDVQEIQSGSGGVPGATPVAQPVASVTGLQTGSPRLGSGSGGVFSTVVSGNGGAPGATAAPRVVRGLAALAGVGVGAALVL